MSAIAALHRRFQGGALPTWRALASMMSNAARVRISGNRALMSPLFFSWEINSACNLRCPYCYLHERSYGFGDEGLSFSQIRTVLTRIKAVTTDVMLLGGEPYIHPVWDDIVDHAANVLGLRTRCITNGLLLESHMQTTGLLDLLVVSYDFTRERIYPRQMASMRRQLAAVTARYPKLSVLINFVLCADDDPAWVIDRIEKTAEAGYNVFVNIDRHLDGDPVDKRIVHALKSVKRRTGRVNMTDVTLDWMEDVGQPVPYCHPTLLPLLDPRARLIYPCCYYDEQNAGSLLDMDYSTLLRKSVSRFGTYPFDKCATCKTTAYLDAAVTVRSPRQGISHFHSLYNH